MNEEYRSQLALLKRLLVLLVVMASYLFLMFSGWFLNHSLWFAILGALGISLWLAIELAKFVMSLDWDEDEDCDIFGIGENNELLREIRDELRK